MKIQKPWKSDGVDVLGGRHGKGRKWNEVLNQVK